MIQSAENNECVGCYYNEQGLIIRAALGGGDVNVSVRLKLAPLEHGQCKECSTKGRADGADRGRRGKGTKERTQGEKRES